MFKRFIIVFMGSFFGACSMSLVYDHQLANIGIQFNSVLGTPTNPIIKIGFTILTALGCFMIIVIKPPKETETTE